MTSGDSPGKGEQKVALADAREQVRRVCERLALLHYAFAKTLVDELGEEKGRQTAMNAIKLYSKMIGERVRDHVRTQDLEPSAENYRDDLPANGMHDRVEVVHVVRCREDLPDLPEEEARVRFLRESVAFVARHFGM